MSLTGSQVHFPRCHHVNACVLLPRACCASSTLIVHTFILCLSHFLRVRRRSYGPHIRRCWHWPWRGPSPCIRCKKVVNTWNKSVLIISSHQLTIVNEKIFRIHLKTGDDHFAYECTAFWQRRRSHLNMLDRTTNLRLIYDHNCNHEEDMLHYTS